jgi:hypothetical protein
MTFQTVPGLGQSIGLILTTGEHSVIPYHSNIVPFEHNSLNLLNTSVGHFSAHTTTYLILLKSSHDAKDIIIFKNVGVAVIDVTFVCFIIFKIVLASLGSGV